MSRLFHNDVAEEGLVLLPLSSAPEFLCIGEYCVNVFIANNHVLEYCELALCNLQSIAYTT